MSVFVDKDTKLIIGDNVSVGTNTAIDCFSKIEIGSETMISWNCMIMTRDGHHIIDSKTKEVLNPIKDVKIGKNCWICQHALILKGAEIPDSCVIGANSVVSKKLDEPHCVYAGNKKVKQNIDIIK